MSSESGVLVVRFGSLGDVILSFGAARALKEAKPGRPLTYLVKEPYAELVRSQPWADEVWGLDDDARSWKGLARLRQRLEERSWDAVCDLQASAATRRLVRGLGARRAVWQKRGIARRWIVWSRPLRDVGIEPAPVRPAWLRFADAARELGAQTVRPPRADRTPEAEAEAERLWQEWGVRPGERVYAFAPGAAWRTKEWPVENGLSFVTEARRRGARVLLVGTADERARFKAYDERAKDDGGIRWATDRLGTIAALLSRCDAAVMPDSGLGHLAAAVGTKVVTLFGSTSPVLGFAPAGDGHVPLSLDLACQPCDVHGKDRCPLGHFRCLRNLSTHRVWIALDRRSRGVA